MKEMSERLAHLEKSSQEKDAKLESLTEKLNFQENEQKKILEKIRNENIAQFGTYAFYSVMS